MLRLDEHNTFLIFIKYSNVKFLVNVLCKADVIFDINILDIVYFIKFHFGVKFIPSNKSYYL